MVPFSPLWIPADIPVGLEPVRHTLVDPNSQIWLAGVWIQAKTDALRARTNTHNP